MRKHAGIILVLSAIGYFVWRYLVKPTDVKKNAIGPATSAVVNGQRIFVAPPGQQAVMAPDGTWWNVSVNTIKDSIQSFFGNGVGPTAADTGAALAPQVSDAPGPVVTPVRSAATVAGVIPSKVLIVDYPGPAQRVDSDNAVAVGPVEYPSLPDNHPMNESPRAGLFMTPRLDGGPIGVTEEYMPVLKSVDRGDGDTDNVVVTIPTPYGAYKWKELSNEIM